MIYNRHTRRRILVAASTLLAAGALLTLLLASPLAMRYLATRSHDWAELSDVAQAYGGASAVISSLAFAGIAASLILQWRQNRITLLAAVRERHFDLVALSLENPDLAAAIEPPSQSLRVAMYANLHLGHWFLEWQLDLMSDRHLMHLCRVMFTNPEVMQWWTTYGSTWTDPSVRHGKRFMKLVNASAEQAIEVSLTQSGKDPIGRPPASEDPHNSASSVQTRHQSRTTLGVALAAATVGSLITIAASGRCGPRRRS